MYETTFFTPITYGYFRPYGLALVVKFLLTRQVSTYQHVLTQCQRRDCFVETDNHSDKFIF